MHATRVIGVSVVAVAMLGFAVLGAAPALAEETSCSGSLGAVTVDNVRVPSGATCTMNGTRVQGTVYVERDARLDGTGLSVIGNVQAEGAADVRVRDSSVGGSVQVKQGGTATVENSQVTADIQYDQNTGALRAASTEVGGNVQVVANRGGADIRDNTIDGNLQCKENNPAPTGGGNVVQGSAEDQCTDLTGQPGTTPGQPTPTPSEPDDDNTNRTTRRLAGPDRFATAVAISADAFPQGAPVVYLARADAFADALAASSLSRGPVLLVPACGSLPAVVGQEIARLNPTEVVALGGPAAICDDMLTQAAAA